MSDAIEGAVDRGSRSTAPRGRREPLWIRVTDRSARVAAIASGLVLAVMALHVIVDVSMRNLSNQSPPGTLDSITYLWMPAVSTLGLGLAQLRDEQIRVTLLVDQATESTRRWVIAAGDALTGLLVLWMTYLAYEAMVHALTIDETTILGIPIWPARIIVFLAYVVFAASIAARIVREVIGNEPVLSEIDSLVKADINEQVL